MPIARRDSGFTLLELVVAISLTAIVLLILQTGLRLTEQAWRRGNDRITALETRLAERETVQAQVSSAIPRVIMTEYQQQQVQLLSFRGDPEQIRFLSNYSWEGHRNFGLWLASYQIIHQSDGAERLVVSETGFSSQPQLVDFLMSNRPVEAPGRPFGEPANRIEFSYFRPETPGNPAGWIPEWRCDKLKQMPRGVRIHWQTGKDEQNLLLLIPVQEEAK